ncbi:uncharacterized protein DUF3574 [Humitalea rosea]|uniref:Uncharacterized protein DUF3574 n=1 Tax=Humitalea rosea TaxID=990373 RepID=A0A2W7HZ83_9PROT|nr:DUF3574 domain-containing protein [Humitalea rosea]PZW39846.1 uncharacterized protein DUF3574 [Humitalea rosea]
MRAGFLLPCLLLLAGCAAPAACPPGLSRAVLATAYFGLGRRDAAPVPEAAWQAFLADTVTPAFPDGLTAWPAAGQWRSGAAILREESRVLFVVLPGATQAEAIARLAPVEAEWRRRQGQESVLRVLSEGCAGF